MSVAVSILVAFCTNEGEAMTLPTEFCWTKFGTEAGEEVDSIFARKEEERIANDGVFLWGIGNAIGPSLSDYLKQARFPKVVFSPMLCKPMKRDVEPAQIAYWTEATGLDGRRYQMPTYSLVTSSFNSKSQRQVRYALVCHSGIPISEPNGFDKIFCGQLRNWKSGAVVGSSQVTCVVRRILKGASSGPIYRAALVATLHPPYLLRLTSPRLVPKGCRLDGLSGNELTKAVKLLLSSRRSGDAHVLPAT